MCGRVQNPGVSDAAGRAGEVERASELDVSAGGADHDADLAGFDFLRDIPDELYESMRADGAGHWRLLWSLAVPLSRPALITVTIYDALNVWNGFLFPLILTQSPDKRVLPLFVWSFQGEFTINTPAILAAVVLSTLPILALYILGRRQLIGGLTAGFGK
jgi:raffinose/stachyose/melibiose transport system permease protein